MVLPVSGIGLPGQWAIKWLSSVAYDFIHCIVRLTVKSDVKSDAFMLNTVHPYILMMYVSLFFIQDNAEIIDIIYVMF